MVGMSILMPTDYPKMPTDFLPKCPPEHPEMPTDLPEMPTMHYISKTILKRYKTSSIASRPKRVLRSPETPNHTQEVLKTAYLSCFLDIGGHLGREIGV